MKKILFVIATLFICNYALAQDKVKGTYEEGFNDGGVFFMAERMEDEIVKHYQLLKMLQGIDDEKINSVRERIVVLMNTQLMTLGTIIKDIRSNKVMSPHFNEVVRKELGLGNEAEVKFNMDTALDFGSFFHSKELWKILRDDRKQYGWQQKYENEKVKELMEKDIELALETYSKYGTVFEPR